MTDRKERERAEREREGRVLRYRQIMKCVSSAASWGGYHDVAAVMADYNPEEFTEGEDEVFSEKSLTDGLLLMQGLLEWRGYVVDGSWLTVK